MLGGTEAIFPTGRPAVEGDVVDREDFIKEMIQHLTTGHDVMLTGPRRIGKSGIAGEVMRRMQAQGAYVAYVDAFHATSLQSFAARVMQAAIELRTGIFKDAAKTAETLGQWLARARVAAKIHDIEIGVAFQEAKKEPLTLLDLALQTAEKVAKADNRRLLFVVDEFQDVLKFGGDQALKMMRATIQHQTNTVYLFLGSQMDIMQNLFGNPSQAFFRFAIEVHLPDIPWEEWVAYITNRLARYKMTISGQALGLLRERTGGHPHCLMLVTERAFTFARVQNVGEITADDVLVGYEVAFDHLNHLYAQQWAKIREHAHDADILAALVDGHKPFANSARASGKTTTGLNRLIDMGIILRGGRGEYRLVEPMFGEWIRALR